MKLKRIYDPQDAAAYKATRLNAINETRNELMVKFPGLLEAAAQKMAEIAVDARNDVPRPAPAYLSLGDTGTSPEQNFSTQFVTAGLNAGWIELSGDELTLHSHPEDLHYEIRRTPGRYCLHCGEKLTDDAGGEMARLHIAQKHRGIASPDPDNPAGYIMLNHFECVLDEAQHEKYRVKDPAAATVFPVKES